MQISVCYIFILILIFSNSCSSKKENTHTRSFYYWKTIFKLNSKEKEAIEQLDIKRIYLRFFDADWNESIRKAEPRGNLIINDTVPESVEIVPVVYITNKTLIHIPDNDIEELATNIFQSVSAFSKDHKINFREVQVDCDWTDKSRNNYFILLNIL